MTVALTEHDYVSVVTDLSQRGFRGGIIYDGVIARAATWHRSIDL
jgi:hypothetical protein